MLLDYLLDHWEIICHEIFFDRWTWIIIKIRKRIQIGDIVISQVNKLLIFTITILIGVSLFSVNSVNAGVLLQQPTIALPTVTGTPSGVIATVPLDQEEHPNVRSSPNASSDENIIGVLLPGQKVPVLGRTAGGDWVLIAYQGVVGGRGWVYSVLVSLTPGELPIIEPPSTPTPAQTQTIDPTLAAQFIQTPIPTKGATFTQPAPLVIPTFTDLSSSTSGIPMGLVIFLTLGLGILIGLFAFFQNR